MNRALKIVLAIVAAVVVVWLLFNYIFPWVDRTFLADPTLESAPAPLDVRALAPSAA